MEPIFKFGEKVYYVEELGNVESIKSFEIRVIRMKDGIFLYGEDAIKEQFLYKNRSCLIEKLFLKPIEAAQCDGLCKIEEYFHALYCEARMSER